ncbi:MAG: ABC transporter ATP-binding protein [Verrucomicrobiales bacterium]|jgi:NitT/TauT family transport system ATP-binding protein|nr:ABC transporter ATP-binding protein [Verrucomicrobiales bacterium]
MSVFPQPPARAAVLQLERVACFLGHQLVLDDLNLTVSEGEFVALLGPSGSGKTTLLRLLAGLARPTSGRVTHRGVTVSGADTSRGLVFQDYALFPWLTMTGNLALAVGKSRPGLGHRQRTALAEEFLEMVGLPGTGRKYPFELSGGMRQRGAIARAFALGSEALLLDEPFGALDPLTRIALQDLLLGIWGGHAGKKTVLFVTHDLDEALYLSDRVIVLGSSPGRILADLPLTLPRPRDREAAPDQTRDLRREIENLFRRDTRRRLTLSVGADGDGAGI